MRSVEIREAVLVPGEMRRDPVENHADAVTVQAIDEEHEIVWRPVARGRREVARGLVTPGAVKRMLGQRKKLDVGEAQVGDVRGKLGRQLAIGQESTAVAAAPGACMHFVGRQRRGERVARTARCHPVGVAPLVIEIPHARGRLRRRLPRECERIALVGAIAVIARRDVVLVARTGADATNEAFPDARTIDPRRKRMPPTVPAVEVADDRYKFGVRSPDRECRAGLRIFAANVRPEFFVKARMRAFPKQIDVVRGQRGARGQGLHAGERCGLSHGAPLRGSYGTAGREFSPGYGERGCKKYKAAPADIDWALCNSWS